VHDTRAGLSPARPPRAGEPGSPDAARSASIACLALICSLIVAGAPRPAQAIDWQKWIDPTTAPFIPIPLIDTDPDSGRTFGLMPTWLQTGSDGSIHRIFAPEVYTNNYFGLGAAVNLYDYPSDDTQWSAYAGIEQRVEREVDINYASGLQRLSTWSFTGRLHYYVDGTPRFFGVGNDTTLADQTNYTSEQETLQAMPGWNINHRLQLAYMLLAQNVDVTPGTIRGVPSIQRRFGAAGSLGDTSMVLNRMLLIYDTRDDVYIPTRGSELISYAGLASREGIMNPSLYSEAGFDGRTFLPLSATTVLALHTALRYLLEAHHLPFWALSSIGGDRSYIGGDQPLRGFGAGRFSDLDSFSFTAELRQQVATINTAGSDIDLQLAPFIEAGRVFRRESTDPISHLHDVGGLGIRGLARPYIVGYLDIGYGSEGMAVFTGINYPF